MTECERIQDQMNRVYEGGAWHGPAVREALAGVTAAAAARRPSGGAHSIGEIALHMTTWKRVVLRRVRGERFTVTDAEDWRPFAGGDTAWREALAEMESVHRELVAEVGRLGDARLEERIRVSDAGESSVHFQLHGAIQHDAYHAGQIALLRKLGQGS